MVAERSAASLREKPLSLASSAAFSSAGGSGVVIVFRRARGGGHPVRREGRESHKRRGVLDHPLEPVIRRPFGRPVGGCWRQLLWRQLTPRLDRGSSPH